MSIESDQVAASPREQSEPESQQGERSALSLESLSPISVPTQITEPEPKPTVGLPSKLTSEAWSVHLEWVAVSLVSAWVLWLSSRQLGVWELGEFTQVKLLDWMWTHETWMQVNLPLEAVGRGDAQGGARAVAELAPGWWPALLTWSWLRPLGGATLSPEFYLRAPQITLIGLSAGALYEVARRWRESRLVALTATTLFIITPAVVFGARHALASGGVGAGCAALTALAFINVNLRPISRGWWLIGVVAWVMSALSLGALGLIYPLILLLSSSELRARARQHWLSLGSAALLIGFIYWRSWVKRASGVDVWSLYVTIDPLTQTHNYADWGGFQNTLHLLGFGLFPLGAFLPVAFYTLRAAERAPRDRSVNVATRGVADLLIAALTLGFFMVVLLAPYQGLWGGGALLCAPSLALGVAILLCEGPSHRRATTLHVLATLLFALLISRGIKHDPSLILSALSGVSDEATLPELTLWPRARSLSLALCVWMLLYLTRATDVVRSIGRRSLDALASSRSAPHSRAHLHARHPAFIVAGCLGAVAMLIPELVVVIPRWVVARSFTLAPFWGEVSLSIRLVTLSALGFAVVYWAVYLSARLYHALRSHTSQSAVESETRNLTKLKAQEWWMALELATLSSFIIITPHYLGRLPMWRFMRSLIEWLEPTRGQIRYERVVVVHLWLIVALWASLMGAWRLYMYLSRGDSRLVSAPAPAPAPAPVSAPAPALAPAPRRRLNPIGALRALFGPKPTLAILLFGLFGFNLFVAPVEVSDQMSHRDLIERYQSFAQPQDELALYKVRDAWRGYYLRDLKEIDEAELRRITQRDTRALMIIEREQLSRLNKRFRELTQRHLSILDEQHHQLRLATTRLAPHEEDRNPIRRAVIDELPKGVHTLPEPIDFEGRVELVAWRFNPETLRRGRTAKMQIFWRVKRRVYGKWKVFVHVDDPPRGQRIHGDHDPVEGLYPTQDWRVGDLILDEHTLKVSATLKPASFIFYAGLFRGKTRMKIKNTSDKLKDKENRAKLGRVRVR